MTEATVAEIKKRKLVGRVVSDKTDKTITVRVERRVPHKMYKKIVTTSYNVHAHDADNTAHTGDLVSVIESRPYSKTKHWTLVSVLERAK